MKIPQYKKRSAKIVGGTDRVTVALIGIFYFIFFSLIKNALIALLLGVLTGVALAWCRRFFPRGFFEFLPSGEKYLGFGPEIREVLSEKD